MNPDEGLLNFLKNPSLFFTLKRVCGKVIVNAKKHSVQDQTMILKWTERDILFSLKFRRY